jgi:hypothetical protein
LRSRFLSRASRFTRLPHFTSRVARPGASPRWLCRQGLNCRFSGLVTPIRCVFSIFGILNGLRASSDASMANTDNGLSVTPDASQQGTGDMLSPVDTVVATAIHTSLEGATLNGVDVKGQHSQTPLSPSDGAISPLSTTATIASGVTSTSQPSQPKRFSAVNINKKFLEKNSSAAGATQTSSNSVAAKAGGSVGR